MPSGLPTFSAFFAFGDSLIDPGNALKAAEFLDSLPFTSLPNGAPTADKGYFEGRFTDGWNFADLVANKLIGAVQKTTFPYGFEDPVFGIPIDVSKPSGNNLSFAYGGAQVIQGDELVPDLDAQTDAYKHYSPNPSAVLLITMGGNDVRDMVPAGGTPVTGAAATAKLSAIAAEFAQEVGQLFAFGARHVLVTGIPDVGLVPEYAGQVDEAAKRALATQYSEQLDALVKTALGQLVLPAGADLRTFNFIDFSDAVIANPAAYGITNTTQGRMTVQQGALDPVGSGFLFWDKVHPSAQIHAQTAARILDSMNPGAPPDALVPFQTGPRILGAVEAQGGLDAFTVSLVAGHSYTFDLFGISSGAGSLADPRLVLRNSAGAVVAEDDDLGLGLDSHLVFTPSVGGTYTLQATAVGVVTGSYVLQGPDLRGSNVHIEGGALADTMGAVAGTNLLRGNDGADSVAGGSGVDDIGGGNGDDKLYGNGGNDLVQGNAGRDLVDGGSGADTLHGGQGSDLVRGGTGNDWLAGDRDNDTLTGGSGADVFYGFGAGGVDRVTDFHLAEGDRVQLEAGTTYTLAQVNADTVITMSGGGQMILVGVPLASLSGAWIFS